MTRFLSIMTAVLLAPAIAFAAAEPGKPAPDFTAKDITGKEHTLSDYKGKIVVLEWNNPGCPFVVKHYSSKNMQGLQAKAAADGIVWLTVNSSAEGKEGHMDAVQAAAYVKEQGAVPTAYILDTTGSIGQAMGAAATPQMIVIGADGKVVYTGSIDDNSSADPKVALTANNYVTAAIAAIKAGKAPAVSVTSTYGCSVKYAD